MVELNEKTRTATNEPENNNTIVSSLTSPTREEIIAQLKKHLAEHLKDTVTPEEVSTYFGDKVSKSLEEALAKYYGDFSKDVPQNTILTITTYPDGNTLLFDKEYIHEDCAPCTITEIECSSIHLSMTILSTLGGTSLSL